MKWNLGLRLDMDIGYEIGLYLRFQFYICLRKVSAEISHFGAFFSNIGISDFSIHDSR